MKHLKETLLFCFLDELNAPHLFFLLYGLNHVVRMQIQELVESNPFQLSEREYTYLAKEMERLPLAMYLSFGSRQR